jgi:hypothetical protein
MKRFSIIGRQVGADIETEICQCDSNPDPIVQALKEKTTSGRRHLNIYELVRVVDNQEQS